MQAFTETIMIQGAAITVFLPASYRSDATRRFAALLMLTPGLKSQEGVASLHVEGVLPEMIVAEITAEERVVDPASLMAALAERFRILDQPAARWIGGMGHAAIRALRCILDHPEIFGSGLCFSSSFEGAEGAPPPHSPMLLHLDELSAMPKNVRIYFDYGTVGLDECYELYHRDLGAILREKGWSDGREFTILRHTGGAQDLASCQCRMNSTLRWLARR